MMPRALSIGDGIWQVGGPDFTAPEDAAVYLIDANDSAVLIDAGCGGATDLLLANIEAAGIPAQRITALLLTHCHFDHTGGARLLRDKLGCRVYLHELDAPFLEAGDHVATAATWYRARIQACPVDCRIKGVQQRIVVGNRTITALHIPGHSPGSVAYIVVSGDTTFLFAQDVHGPLHPSLHSDQDAYQQSLLRLVDLGANVLCEGHFGIFRGEQEVSRFISGFIR